MSAVNDLPALSAEPSEAAQALSGPLSPEPPVPGGPWLVPVARLAAHPGNVREDLELSTEFCASVASAGVRVPLLVTGDGDGFRVIEGHRRLAAAIQAGLGEVPCVLDPGREGDDAGQFLDMAVANSAGLRRNFTVVEEAAALFSAQEAGASRTRIRKATGRTAAAVKTTLAVGALPATTRQEAAALPRPASLEDLALLAEFDGDHDATAQVLEALRRGYGIEHTAELIRRDRAEAAEHARLTAEIEASGAAVTADLPAGAERLSMLTHGGEPLTVEGHGECPGRGAFFRDWDQLQPVWYCGDPGAHGHATAARPGRAVPGTAGTSPLPAGGDDAQPGSSDDGALGRRVVIEGNRAWAAAGQVRQRWLRDLLTRRTAPRQIAPWVARQLLTMPAPLRACLGTAHATTLFTTLTGQDAAEVAGACEASPAGRLPLLMAAPLITAWENEITGPDDGRRATWRADKYSPCPRGQAGEYLTFLASIGYELSPVEQAVADGVPYTGDTQHDSLESAAGDTGPGHDESNSASGAPSPADGQEPAEGNEPQAA